jgi:prevent-host-death family protein
MTTITLQEAQATLSDLIHRLGPGEEVVITENDHPVARLVPTAPTADPRQVPRLGTLRGTVLSTHGCGGGLQPGRPNRADGEL